MRGRLGDLLAVVAVAALVLVCFARLAARPGSLLVDAERPSVDRAQRDDFRPPGNDLTFVYLPHHLHVAAEIDRTGAMPGWDRSGFAGRPMIGNPQGGLFYPPVWAAWWSRSPAALGWLTVAHLLWAALGTYLLVRAIRAGRPAATVAAGCLVASPYVLAHVLEGHYPHVWTASWYPWAFWSYRRLRSGRIDGAIYLAPILALALLAGHPQEWYYLVVVLSVWAVADAFQAARRRHYRGSLAALAAWGVVVAFSLGLSAVELVPDMAAQAWSLRGSRLVASKVNHYQLHLANLFQLPSPLALGAPAEYLGHDNYWETVLSIGMVPLVLLAIAMARHPDRPLVRGWMVLVAGAVLFAAGRKLGLFSLLFDVVPGMNRFRVPGRSLFLATFGASVLAGLGVDTLSRGSFQASDWRWLGSRLRLWALVVGAALGVLVLVTRPDVPRQPAQPDRPLSLREIRTMLRASQEGASREALAARAVLTMPVVWLGLAGMAACAALGRRRPDRRNAWAGVAGLLALAELGWYGHALVRVAPAEAFLGPDAISLAMTRLAPPRGEPFRIRARDTLYHDLRAWSNGHEKININDSFQLQHAADLYEPLYALLYPPDPPRVDEPMGAALARFHQDVRQSVLDRMSVAYLISDHVESDAAWPLVATGRSGRWAFAIHKNPTAMPRAYVVPRAERVAERDWSLARLRSINPREAVTMESDPLAADGPRQPFTPAEWSANDPDRLVLRVTTDAPGLLVVADTWMPGWTATVDGRARPVLRGNHAQRVVPIDRAGRHLVELRYQPPGLRAGLFGTAASALVWITIAAVASWRRSRRQHPSSRLQQRPAMARELTPSRVASGATTPVSAA